MKFLQAIHCLMLLLAALFFFWIGGLFLDAAWYVMTGPTWEEVKHIPIQTYPKPKDHI